MSGSTIIIKRVFVGFIRKEKKLGLPINRITCSFYQLGPKLMIPYFWYQSSPYNVTLAVFVFVLVLVLLVLLVLVLVFLVLVLLLVLVLPLVLVLLVLVLVLVLLFLPHPIPHPLLLLVWHRLNSELISFRLSLF